MPVPKSVKERMFRKTRRKKAGPVTMVPKDRVAPRKTADNTPRMYRYGRMDKDEEEKEMKEELNEAKDDVVKTYADMKKGMLEVQKISVQLGQVMQQSVQLMQRWEKANAAEQSEREHAARRAEQQAERGVERGVGGPAKPAPGTGGQPSIAPAVAPAGPGV